MPEIIVTAKRGDAHDDGAVMLRERVNISDFESDHFAAQLVERLGWAVNDAHDAEERRHNDARRDGEHVEHKKQRSDEFAVTLA